LHESDRGQSSHHVRVVVEVLQLALSPGADEKLRLQLPAEFESLLSSGSQLSRPTEERREPAPR
jgi:uncharacterized protein (DUF2267 family)